jgi:hypothetical protein
VSVRIGGEMGPGENAVRAHLYSGQELKTPGQDKPFWVEDLNDEGIVLLLGSGRWRTPIPWEALEGVAELLRGRGWVRTSGSYSSEGDTTTLSGYLKQFVYRETANWVAVVLTEAGVLELDRSRPIRARLRAAN